MTAFVLDCSATAGFCLGDEPRAYYADVFDRLRRGDQALVPPLWHYELANSLLVAKKRKKIMADTISAFVENMGSFRIKTISPSWDHSLPFIEDNIYFADAHNLTVYDAAYLILAVQQNVALATTDHALRKAAHSAGIADAVAA
ncbi:MAG TPA: type II toxin-antitoxin system VapC family toxin [Alphaproteobacteria bacterium]|nr:type II toxin-antitoxin system VapC family toxin [Alphaproteobacteria bacterium]